jgi:hypothetical protein
MRGQGVEGFEGFEGARGRGVEGSRGRGEDKNQKDLPLACPPKGGTPESPYPVYYE